LPWYVNRIGPIVTDIILGESDDYFKTVGGSHDIAPPVPGGDHTLGIELKHILPSRVLVKVNIRLFSSVATPSYHVVVGQIDLQNMQHILAYEKLRFDGKM
jgi:hypothetical protein